MKIVKLTEGYYVEDSGEKIILAMSHNAVQRRKLDYRYSQALSAYGISKQKISRTVTRFSDAGAELINTLELLLAKRERDYYENLPLEGIEIVLAAQTELGESVEDVLTYLWMSAFPEIYIDGCISQIEVSAVFNKLRESRFARTEIGQAFLKTLPIVVGKSLHYKYGKITPETLYGLSRKYRRYLTDVETFHATKLAISALSDIPVQGYRIVKDGDMTFYIDTTGETAGNMTLIRINNIVFLNQFFAGTQTTGWAPYMGASAETFEKRFDVDPSIYFKPDCNVDEERKLIYDGKTVYVDSEFVWVPTAGYTYGYAAEPALLWAYSGNLLPTGTKFLMRKERVIDAFFFDKALTASIMFHKLLKDRIPDDIHPSITHEKRAFDDIMESMEFYRHVQKTIERATQYALFIEQL